DLTAHLRADGRSFGIPAAAPYSLDSLESFERHSHAERAPHMLSCTAGFRTNGFAIVGARGAWRARGRRFAPAFRARAGSGADRRSSRNGQGAHLHSAFDSGPQHG